MALPSENDIGTALWARLAGSTAIQAVLGTASGTPVYRTLAPQGRQTPYVIFSFVHGGATNDTPRDNHEPLYSVKAVAPDEDTAWQLDALIHAQLHKWTFGLTSHNCYDIQRENVYAMPEMAGGSIAYHCGAYYRLRISADTSG